MCHHSRHKTMRNLSSVREDVMDQSLFSFKSDGLKSSTKDDDRSTME